MLVLTKGVNVATRKDLHEALKLIGWDMHNIGCDVHAAITPDGKQTDWQCGCDGDLIMDCRSAFGGEHGCTRGTVSFQLRHCTVRIGNQKDAVHVGPIGDRKSAFVSFYNFDRNRKVKP